MMSLFLYPNFVQAKQMWSESDTKLWVSSAMQIAKEVDAGRYVEARQILDELAKHFSHSNFAEKELSVQAIQALSTSIIDLEGRLNRITPNPNELNFYAKRLLMTFDAVGHPYQPMWKSYYPILKRQVDKMISDIKQGKDIREERNILHNHYVILRPALVVTKTPTTVQKVDSLFLFLERDSNKDHQLIALNQLRKLWYPLFYGSEQDVLAVTNPDGKVPVSTFLSVISVIIIGILTFVSWRKRMQSIVS
ncbi:sporulation protein YpjB [Shimazuella soli]|uniref:sporulation protein YpjB n=1 Tax=Shimazuella soli TaxID=1892854 RepID=UPI001F0F95A0|nr:sporulation protein YpjB [Shimazuella soli]